MRECGRMRLRFLCPLLLLLASGCYEPPVRESVLLTIEASGWLHLSVETTFKQGKELSWQERDAIQHVVDLYLLGRDPWIRGLERAEARDITYRMEGSERQPEKIVREALIPSVESLVQVMPDAIANIKLIRDEATRTQTLRIQHIDVPAPIREARQKLEKEIAGLASALFETSESECDLYDYLSRNEKQRRDVLAALQEEGRVGVLLTPEETVLVRRFDAAMQGLATFSSAANRPEGEEAPAITRLSFSAFEHDFCVQLPAEASETVGLPASQEKDAKNLYCAERLGTDDLMERVWPRTDPPLLENDAMRQLMEDPDALEAAPFSCARYDSPEAIEARLWELILPLPEYRISW